MSFGVGLSLSSHVTLPQRRVQLGQERILKTVKNEDTSQDVDALR